MAVAGNGNSQNTGDSVFYETMTLTYDGTVGTEEVVTSAVRLCPNPATDRVFVENTESAWELAQIVDLNGRMVQSSELMIGINEIPTGDLRRGMYFVHLSNTRGASSTRRLILH